MDDGSLYAENITSRRTTALFLAITLIFFLLLAWRVAVGRTDFWAVIFSCFFILFLFYSLNYRKLDIRLTSEILLLRFGIFRWSIPLDNIASCKLDEIPTLMKYGGAGIHFMNINHRYRASFNFLEYPRVVMGLKKKAGPVRDLSISTRQPEELTRLIQENISENERL